MFEFKQNLAKIFHISSIYLNCQTEYLNFVRSYTIWRRVC